MGEKASKIKHKENMDFDILLNDAYHGRLDKKLSDDYTRPIYYGTKLQKEVEDAKNKARARDFGDSGSF
jgi:hypothetical protein